MFCHGINLACKYLCVCVCVCNRWRCKAHEDFVQCVCWNPVSHELARCSWDGSLLCKSVIIESATDESVTSHGVAMNHH